MRRPSTAANDEAAELAGQPDDAGYRAEAYVDPTGADPAGIPDPMPDHMGIEGDAAAGDTEDSDQMDGEAPTG